MTPFLLALLVALPCQDKSSEDLLAEADALMARARTNYETGKMGNVLKTLLDAGFDADEARAKYQAVQVIAGGDNRRRAVDGAREANQLIKLVNDARVALANPRKNPPPVVASEAPPAAPAAKAPPPPEVPTVKPPSGPVVDLLNLLDAEKDVVAGKWMISPGRLVLAEKKTRATPWPRVEVPYRVPDEYDLTVKFRCTGNGEIALLLSKGGVPFAFEMGMSENKVFAIRKVKEPPADPFAVSVMKARCIDGARLYTARVEVRKDSIQAYLDELLIVYTRIDSPQDLSLDEAYELRRKDVVGFVAASQTVVTALEIREIGGRGSKLR